MDDTISWVALRNGLVAAAFCWAVIVGLGYLGYWIGSVVR
jgi:hypothetical protein